MASYDNKDVAKLIAAICQAKGWQVGLITDDEESDLQGVVLGTKDFLHEVLESQDDVEIMFDSDFASSDDSDNEGMN